MLHTQTWLHHKIIEAEAHSQLLKLPAELRIAIYEHTLREGTGSITISPAFKPPALLSTCSQIRKEATPIWLTSNHFSIRITDCDPNLCIAFISYVVQYIRDLEIVIERQFHQREANWPNLLRSCQWSWEHKWKIDPNEDKISPEVTVWKAAHDLTLLAAKEGSSWAMCEKQLQVLRQVAGNMNEKWLN